MIFINPGVAGRAHHSLSEGADLEQTEEPIEAMMILKSETDKRNGKGKASTEFHQA